jgi:hypothetical protein
VDQKNFFDAVKDMKLNKQEQYLYQLHLKNLEKGGVPNPAGGTSTLYQMGINVNGKEVNIPTVWDGKILPPAEAIARAEKEGLEKFPSYGSVKEAEDRYTLMHDYMERDLPKPPAVTPEP